MKIAFVQKKGGSGKSTLATNVSSQLALLGHSVGLLDTDSQKSAAKWYARRRKKHPEAPEIECAYVNGNISDNIIAMAQRNDYLIIDTAGFNSQEMRHAAVVADIVICPFRPKQYDLEVSTDVLSIIDEIRVGNTNMKLFAVINSAPTHNKDSRADDAETYLTAKKFDVLKSRIYNREAYGDAGQEGLGATEFTDEKASQEITALVKEILHGTV